MTKLSVTKLLRLLSVFAVLGFVFAASAQPASAHGMRHHHHWNHHHGVMKYHHCHWMNAHVWSKRYHMWTWRRKLVCH